MTPISEHDESILIACSKIAGALVRNQIGFSDVDLAQDACLAMVQAVRTYDIDNEQGASLKTWLLLKARWRIIDAYRQRTKHRARVNRIGPDVPLGPYDCVDTNDIIGRFEDQLDAEAAMLIPRQILASLSQRDQDVILSFLGGETELSIGNRHHITESRASQIINKFRRTAAREMTEPKRKASFKPKLDPVIDAVLDIVTDIAPEQQALGLFNERDQWMILQHLAGEKSVFIALAAHIHESRVSQILSCYHTRCASIVHQQTKILAA